MLEPFFPTYPTALSCISFFNLIFASSRQDPNINRKKSPILYINCNTDKQRYTYEADPLAAMLDSGNCINQIHQPFKKELGAVLINKGIHTKLIPHPPAVPPIPPFLFVCLCLLCRFLCSMCLLFSNIFFCFFLFNT